MPLNDDILDALTSHAIGLQRLSNANVRKVLALLSRSDARIVERLLREDLTALGRARQAALLRDIRAVLEEAYGKATEELQQELEALATYEVDYQANMLRRVLPVKYNTALPSADQILAAVNSRPFQGRLLKDWYKELERGAFERLRNAIRAGVVEGRTIGELVREIRGTRANGYKDGILQTNRRAAETVVRTAVAHTTNAARESLYRRNKNLIDAVQWVSTLDGRTSAVCRARDGQLYEIDKGPRPPAHPNCRSAVIPVLTSWRKLGLKNPPGSTRASMDGQVAADMTYDEWLRKQPVEMQDDILGKAKGRLFRAGLTMDRYVNRAGDEWTLDELKRREADIWAKAFA